MGKLPFDNDTELAIIKFNDLPYNEYFKKERLFENEIYEPFIFIARGLIVKYKYYESIDDMTIDQLINQVVSFMYSKLNKFRAGAGKAFSYFSVVAKNYLTQMSYDNQKKRQKNIMYMDELKNTERKNSFIYNDNFKNYNKFISKEKFYKEIIVEFEKELNIELQQSVILVNDREKNITKYVLNMLYNSNQLDFINKKFMFYYIQDNSNESRYYIYKTLDKLQPIYNKIKDVVMKKYYYLGNSDHVK